MISIVLVYLICTGSPLPRMLDKNSTVILVDGVTEVDAIYHSYTGGDDLMLALLQLYESRTPLHRRRTKRPRAKAALRPKSQAVIAISIRPASTSVSDRLRLHASTIILGRRMNRVLRFAVGIRGGLFCLSGQPI